VTISCINSFFFIESCLVESTTLVFIDLFKRESIETVVESFFCFAGIDVFFLGYSCAKLNVLISTVKLKAKSMCKLFVRNAFKCIFVKVWLGF